VLLQAILGHKFVEFEFDIATVSVFERVSQCFGRVLLAVSILVNKTAEIVPVLVEIFFH